MNKKWNHPGTGTKYDGLYRSWNGMFQRAGNRSGRNPSYSDVSVCERWKSYDNFFEDMSSTWFKGATIDKDSIKPGNRVYCKEYCCWVSQSENTIERNKRLGSPSKGLEARTKIAKAKSKKYQCIETGEIITDAANYERKHNLASGAIRHTANPNCEQKTANGYHWKYSEE